MVSPNCLPQLDWSFGIENVKRRFVHTIAVLMTATHPLQEMSTMDVQEYTSTSFATTAASSLALVWTASGWCPSSCFGKSIQWLPDDGSNLARGISWLELSLDFLLAYGVCPSFDVSHPKWSHFTSIFKCLSNVADRSMFFSLLSSTFF